MAEGGGAMKFFFKSHNPFGNKYDYYPDRLTSIIQDELEKKQEGNDLSHTTDANKLVRSISQEELTCNLPNCFEAKIGWFEGLDNSGKNVLVGIQMTPRGGYRNIYKITYQEGDTKYRCPVRKRLFNIPEYFIDSATHVQMRHLFWSNSKIHYGNKLEQIRRISNNLWIPYKKEDSEIILDAISQGNDSCEISIGIINITIQLKNDDIPSGFGYQIINSRKHFVKIIDTTQQEYDSHMQKQLEENSKILEGAVGDTTTCSICQEDLISSKCVKLGCGHAFHGLCIQYWVSHSGEQKCPICKQSTCMGGDESVSIYSGR